MLQYLPTPSCPPSFPRHQLRESASTTQSLQLPGTSQLATAVPSFDRVRPATGGHPEFKDEEAGAPSAFEGEARGGRPECEDETDGACKILDHNKRIEYL